MMRSLAMLLIVLHVSLCLASAASRTVGPSDDLNGAIRQLQPGDTLTLAPGTYTQALNGAAGTSWPSGDSWERAITIRGAPGATVTLKAGPANSTYAMIQLESSRYLIFDNLTLDCADFAQNSSNKCLKIGGGDHIRFQNSTLKNARGYDPGPKFASSAILDTSGGYNEYLNLDVYGNAGYGIYQEASNFLIANSRFHDNDRYGIHVWSESGRASNGVIRDTKVYNNGGNSYECFGGCYMAGILMGAGRGNKVFNNVIYNNALGGIQAGGSALEIYNNTIVGNQREGCIFGDVNGGTARNNICYQNAKDSITSDLNASTNLLGVDPQFVNASGRDYHVKDGSPALKNGADLSSLFRTDFDLKQRNPSAFGIGAYASGTGGGLPPTTSLPAPRNLRLVTQ